MPLSETVTTEWCEKWMVTKATQWDKTGFRGPWSIWLDDRFAGWGGLQPDDEYESAIGIVLEKWAWGHGREVMSEILNRSLQVGFRGSTLIELPQSRAAGKWLEVLGASEIKPGVIQGHVFNRYEIPILVLLESLGKPFVRE